MTDLGSVGDFRDSFALDINNSGQIVGVLRSPSTSPHDHALLYTAGKMIDLNSVPLSDPDWVLIEATAVNDRGQIVGWGLHNGQRRGFLLTATGDTDGDGCDDLRENGSSAQEGGQRNYLNFWDFYDVWSRAGASAPWVRDRAINVPGDILGVATRFGSMRPGGAPAKGAALAEALTPPTSDTGYHAAFDRGPQVGPFTWNLAGPDGGINVVDDILGVARQFGHSCL